jgi:hypothetical protein
MVLKCIQSLQNGCSLEEPDLFSKKFLIKLKTQKKTKIPKRLLEKIDECKIFVVHLF